MHDAEENSENLRMMMMLMRQTKRHNELLTLRR